MTCDCRADSVVGVPCGERGRHADPREVHGGGVDLGELDVQVGGELCGGVRDGRDGAQHVRRAQVDAGHTPLARRLRGVEVAHAVEAPRLGVDEGDLLRLALHPPLQVAELAQLRPLALVVLRLHHHALRLLAARAHAALKEDRRHPLTPALHVKHDAVCAGGARDLRRAVLVDTAARAAHLLAGDDGGEHAGGGVEKTDVAVEEGRRLACTRRDHGHSDGVDTLRQQQLALLVRTDQLARGHGDGVVVGDLSHGGTDRGGGELSRDALAVHLVPVEPHDHAVLEAQQHAESCHALRAGHGEGGAIELELVGGVGEAAHGGLAPGGEVLRHPAGRQLAHLVVPRRGALLQREDVERVDGGRAQRVVEARLQQQLAVPAALREHLDERPRAPARLLRGERQRHRVLLHAQPRHALVVVLLHGVERLGVHHLLPLREDEALPHAVLAVGAPHHHRCARAVAHRQRDGSVVRRRHGAGDREHGGRQRRTGRALDGAGVSSERKTGRE